VVDAALLAMKTHATNKGTERARSKSGRAGRIETAAVSGAVAGAAAGAVAGPLGAAAGLVVGGAAGAIAGAALADDADRRHAHDDELDREIGVTSAGIGAAPPGQPPARIGAFSAASSGAASEGGATPSEGPMQDVDD
jgi:hypothetical protein